MSILNVTPCQNIVTTGGQEAQIVGRIHGTQAVNISADSTATALPKLTGGNNDADYFKLTTDGAMYVVVGTSSEAGTVADGTGVLMGSGDTLWIGNGSDYTHIAKADKA